MERLRKAGILALPTGIDHGTIAAVIGKKHFEITTLRRDVATDGRRATIAFSDSWLEDAQRRDFTINTLLADADGKIFDPLGTAMADLTARRVVFVGDPAARIAEDALRILRFYRFHALYGQGAPDPAGHAACIAAASTLDTLSRERRTQELLKILSVDNPADIIQIMIESSALRNIAHPDFSKNMLSAFPVWISGRGFVCWLGWMDAFLRVCANPSPCQKPTGK
jgi:poly(A) polymerase